MDVIKKVCLENAKKRARYLQRRSRCPGVSFYFRGDGVQSRARSKYRSLGIVTLQIPNGTVYQTSFYHASFGWYVDERPSCMKRIRSSSIALLTQTRCSQYLSHATFTWWRHSLLAAMLYMDCVSQVWPAGFVTAKSKQASFTGSSSDHFQPIS